MAHNTTRFGVSTPDSGSDACLPGSHDLKTIADGFDAIILGAAKGLASARPPAGNWGHTWYSTDIGELDFDTGSAWVNLYPGAGAGPTRDSKTWAISTAPAVTTADENPYPAFYIPIEPAQSTVLHGVIGHAPGASTNPTFKIRRKHSGSWADITGFGTTGSPLAANNTLITPGDLTLADGDYLGLWVVSAGSTATGLSVSAVIDQHPA